MAEEMNLRIDPNIADAETLDQLPGIGPELALRIVAARPFDTQDDLQRVSGIGPAVLARLRPFLALPPGTPETEMAGEPGIAWEAKGPPIAAVEPDKEEALPELAAPEVGEEEHEEAPPQTPTPEPETWSEEAEELWVESLPAPMPPPIEASTQESTAEPESAPPEVEPAIAVEKAAPLSTSKSQPAMVTRGQAFWMVAAGSVLALLIALVLSLGILAAVNRGQLQFVTPADLMAMSVRVDGLDSKADTLNKDVAGLRARLDNLEALSGRVSAVEEIVQSLRSDLDAAGAKVESLDQRATELQTQLDGVTKRTAALEAQAKDMDARIKAVQTQVDRFQAFLVGLRDLLNTAFQEGEVVK